MWKAIPVAAVSLLLLFKVEIGEGLLWHATKILGVCLMALAWLIVMRSTKAEKNKIEQAEESLDESQGKQAKPKKRKKRKGKKK